MHASTTGRRGRPPSHEPAARTRILDALVQLLDTAPASRPSLRRVAQEAGVSPALVHYHFGDLEGLMRCLLRERVLHSLQPVLPQPPLQTEQDASGALVKFLQRWTMLAQRHPWLSASLLQSPSDGDPDFAPWERLPELVRQAQRQGTVRPDLPATQVALLLVTMGMMPQLAHTALAAGLDAATLQEDVVGLTLRQLAVLQDGVARLAPAES